MRKAIALLLAICAAACAAPGSSAPASPATQPNFVVVMADDQTIGEMGAMPQTRQRIGGAGVSFERFYASFPLCCPSRATFLTGQYSHNHGVLGNGTPVGGYYELNTQQTLGPWLQAAGYHTIHVGKFLNRYGLLDPTEVPQGWDEWYAALQSSSDKYFGYQLNENGVLRNYGRNPADYKTYVEAEKATAAIRRQAEQGPAAKPFFLFLGALAPHLPATPAPTHSRRFANLRLPRGLAFDERNVSDKPSFIRKLDRLSAAKTRQLRSSYLDRARSLLALDETIGQVLDELESQGLMESTYVIFMSDNGFFFGQHRLPKGKYLPYEPASRLPLMIRGPGIPAGGSSEELVGNIDLAPTILELAGASPGVEVDGRSLVPFARDPALRTGRPILFEANSRDRPSIGIPYTGVKTERYSFIRYRNGEQELYDLQRDPRQLRSRHRDRKYAATERALAAALRSLRSCEGAACGSEIGTIPAPG